MPVGPYSQDPLTRITNVHWGGTIFILVADGGPYYVSVAGLDEEGKVKATVQTITLPDSPKGPVERTIATSYRIIDDAPTFLLCGSVSYSGEGGIGLAAAILMSNDGLDWRHVFLSETGFDVDSGTGRAYPITASGNALVRSNDGAFYFDQRVARFGLGIVETPTGSSTWIHEQIFRSATGNTWTGPISDRQVSYGAEIQGYRSQFPPDHCSHNNCKDALGQNVPDGFMREDMEHTDAGVLMRPKTPITINYGIPSFDYGKSGDVEIVATSISTSSPAVGPVNCVAGANGIWMAGGDSVAVSFDDGTTWGPVEGITGVVSISAAALSET